MSLLTISTHPIQYHVPVFRLLQSKFGIPVTAIYGSDFSVAGYHDTEFGLEFAWDVDLLSGYTPIFLSRVADGGARSLKTLSPHGLNRILTQINPSVVLLSGYSPQFLRWGFWHAWRAGFPLLFRGETTDHALPRGPIKHWIRDRFLKWFYQKFDCLLYIGQHSFDHYKRMGFEGQKVIFSPYCVDTGAFCVKDSDRDLLREPTRQNLRIRDDQIVILFSGKLVPRKAPNLLLTAVKELPSDIREQIVVLFVGDGSMRTALEMFAGGAPAIQGRFVGFTHQHSLSRYYHAADLFVLPSIVGETWGLVTNEALHHGVPCVVSSKVGCAPDLIVPGLTGEIFESGYVNSLRCAIQRALRLIGREEVRVLCQHQVDNYSVEKAAEGIARAYTLVSQVKHTAQEN